MIGQQGGIADPGQEGGPGAAPLQHAVHALDLVTHTWSQLGTLDLPADLSGYSVVHDPLRQRLYVIGGITGQLHNRKVYQVDRCDLSVEPLPMELPEAALRTSAAASLAADHRTLLLFGGQRAGVDLTDLWAVDVVLDKVAEVTPHVPGAVQGFVVQSRVGGEIVVQGAAADPSDPSLRLVAVDPRSGEARAMLALDLRKPEPGRYQGQVRDGVGPSYPKTIPVTVEYPGQLTVAMLSAVEQGLGIRVQDSRGLVLDRSASGAEEQQVAWLGQPGERYLISVGTGDGYAPDAIVDFEVVFAGGLTTELGRYSGRWAVDRLARQGEVVFLSGPRGLQAVDLADPSRPTLLARKNVPGLVQGMALVKDRACLARTLRRRGLRCLDVSRPADLHWHGPGTVTLGMGRSIAAQGELGYVAEGIFGVGIYHLASDEPPFEPRRLARLWTGGLAHHVAVQAGRLYVALLDGTVGIYDLARPLAPDRIGSIEASGPVAGLLVQGETAHLHLLDPGSLGSCLLGLRCPEGQVVEVFDLGDPAVPLKVGEHDTGSTLAWPQVAFHGGLLLVPEPHGLRVLQVGASQESP